MSPVRRVATALKSIQNEPRNAALPTGGVEESGGSFEVIVIR